MYRLTVIESRLYLMTEGKELLASKLLAFGVSLKEFMDTLSQDDITQWV